MKKTINELKERIRFLEDSEKRYKKFMDSYKAPITMYDLKGNIIFINKTGAKNLGGNSKDLIGKSLYRTLPKNKKSIKERIKYIVRTGKSLRVEDLMEMPDKKRWFLSNLYPVKDSKGKIFAVKTISLDVTEQRRIRENLKKNEEMFRSLFSYMQSGVAVYSSRDGKKFIFKDINIAGEKISKVKRKNIIGKHLLDVFPGVEEFGLLDVFRKVYKTGRPLHHPLKLYKDKRLSNWFENYVYKLSTGEIVAIYDDVTKQKQDEEKLKESEEKYKDLVENMTDVVYSLDKNGKIINVNKAVYNLFGYKPKEVIDQYFFMFIPKEEKSNIIKIFNSVLKGKQVFKETILIDKFKNHHMVEFSLSPIKEKGKIIGAIGILRDITERVNLEKTKNKLIRDMSHSLKTPIAMAQTAMSMAKKALEKGDIDKLSKVCHVVNSNVERINKDVNNMLSVFSLDLQKNRKNISKIYFSKIIEDAFFNVSTLLHEKNLKSVTKINKNAQYIKINERDIEILFRNLIDNAVKFTEKGYVKIETKLKDDKIEINVKDTGCGIDVKDKNKIFDKFYKAHSAIEGSGLGLYICKEIVNMYNGEIRVLSSRINRGTSIIIKLPKNKN